MPGMRIKGQCPARANTISPRSRSSTAADMVMKLFESMLSATTRLIALRVAWRWMRARQQMDQHLELRHVEASRQTLTRHVGDQHAELRVRDMEEVVVVACHLARRFAERHDRRPGTLSGLDGRLCLNLTGSEHLLLHPRLVGVLLEELGHLAGHDVERFGQLAELVARADRNLVHEVPIPQVLGPGEQIVDRAGNLSRQHESNHEGDELDGQEQHAEKRQR